VSGEFRGLRSVVILAMLSRTYLLEREGETQGLILRTIR
jgi:hypothetical protein